MGLGAAPVSASTILRPKSILAGVACFQTQKATVATGGKIHDTKRSVGPATQPEAEEKYPHPYLGCLIPLGLGFIWVAFDRRKQGWHDKAANTVVIRARKE
jgi:hypothetical protein